MAFIQSSMSKAKKKKMILQFVIQRLYLTVSYIYIENVHCTQYTLVVHTRKLLIILKCVLILANNLTYSIISKFSAANC